MTDLTGSPAPTSDRPRGRGLVISGAIVTGIYLLPAMGLLAWLAWGLITAPEAVSMVFAFWLMALLVLTPLWILGIALLGAGRAQQRGSVRGATLAWILAIGGMPMIGVLMGATLALLNSGQGTLGDLSYAALALGIPVLTALALLSGAWLTWGKPQAA